jgi:hypothetical protein
MNPYPAEVVFSEPPILYDSVVAHSGIDPLGEEESNGGP